MNKKIIILVLFIIINLTGVYAIDSVAYPLKVKGDVGLTRNLESSALKLGDDLYNGDEIETKAESYAAIQFEDKSSIIKLFPNTILNIRTEKQGEKYNKKSFLKMGELWAKVEKGTGKFEIETPTTVVSVKGTNFMLNILEDGTTELFTFEGEVIFQNKITGEAETILAGQRGTISGDQPIIVAPFDPEEIDESQNEFINEDYRTIREEVIPRTETEETPIEAPEMIEEEETDDTSSGPFNMGGGVGSVMLGEEIYTQIRLMPELTFGKFGLGLDIDLMIDSNGDVRTEDWDSFEDYVNKIYYLRYGERGDAFYGRLGGFKSYTLGHGLVMKDYSNMLRYPEYKQIGIQLGGKLPVAGMTVELFTANAVKNEILGGRLTIQPLGNTSIPLFSKLVFGGTVAHDRNQIKGLLDSDDDDYPDHFDDFPYDENWHNEIDHDIDFWRDIIYVSMPEHADTTGFTEWFYSDEINALRNPSFDEFETDDITVIGVDYELPLIQNPLFTLSHYGEAAQIIDHKMGFIFPGFYSKFLIFHMNLEYRIYQEDFMPAFFDQLYDEQRAVVVIDSTGKKTAISKEEYQLVDRTKSHGWYGALTTNILNFLFVTVAYEDMYDDNDENSRSLWGKASLDTKIIPKLTKAEIGYSQTGFDKLSEFKTPNTIVSGSLGYSLGGSTQLVGSYQERYIDLNNDGEIKGTEETITSMSMGVEFSF